jgi:peroxiredoxin family protein
MTTPLGVLLASGTHDRAHAALILATGAAAIGREVVVFATGPGCRLFESVRPLEQDPREALLAARGVAGIATLLAAAEELGLRRIACEAGLRAEAIAPESLRPGVEVAGIVTFLAAIGEGRIASF